MLRWRTTAAPKAARRLAAVVLLAVAALAAPGLAGAHIYWPNGKHVGRANLDGSHADPEWVSVSDAVHALAVEGSKIYLATDGGIESMDVDGSSPTTLVSSVDPLGIAVDADYVYWVTDTAIGRAELDGSNPDPTFIEPADAGALEGGIAVDDDYVFWTDFANDSVGRANLDGSDADDSFVTGTHGSPLGVVTYTASSVHWVAWGTNEKLFGAARADGTDVSQDAAHGLAGTIDAMATTPDGSFFDYLADGAGIYEGQSDDLLVSGALGSRGFGLDTGASTAPTISGTTSAAGIAVGDAVHDSAVLDGDAPTGQVTFSLYGPDDATCADTPAFTDTATVSGDDTYESADFTPAAAGTYRWVASYGGDYVNDRAATACDASGQSVVVGDVLTVSVSGSGTGTVSGGGISCGAGDTACTVAVADGTSVTLTATPSGGSSFAGWGGACTGTGGCSVTLSADETVTASFSAPSSGGGSSSSTSQPSEPSSTPQPTPEPTPEPTPRPKPKPSPPPKPPDRTPPPPPIDLDAGRRSGRLQLRWRPGGAGGAAWFELYRNGTLLRTIAAGKGATKIGGLPDGPAVFELIAVDASGNRSQAAKLTLVPTDRPSLSPRRVPQWAWQILVWRNHHRHGPRPDAPRKLPAWYWPWQAWRHRLFRVVS